MIALRCVIGLLFGCVVVTNSYGGNVVEYFGFGNYEDGQRVWYTRMYDGSVEATFDDVGENLGASR